MKQESSNKPMISIIIPAYNVGGYIMNLISDLRAQTFEDWEAIIIDDCSRDSTFEIISKISQIEHKFRVFRREENSGGAYTPRLEASLKANGNFIVPLDADDRINSDYLEKLLKRQIETGADIVHSYFINEREGTKNIIFNHEKLDINGIYEGRDLVKNVLYEWDFGVAGALYKANLYQQVMIEAGKMEIEDSKTGKLCIIDSRNPFIDEFITRLLINRAGLVSFSKDAIYTYQFNPNSVIQNIGGPQIGRLKYFPFLRQFIRTQYGTDSSEWSITQKYYICVLSEAMELLMNRGPLKMEDPGGKKRSFIRREYDSINWEDFRPHISNKFYKILRLGFNISSFLLSIRPAKYR